LIVGPLVGLGGIVAYFAAVATPNAALHRWLELPLLNLAMIVAGVALSCIGIARAKPTLRSRGLAAFLALLNVSFAGAFAWFIFFGSYAMPAAARAPAIGRVAPDFELPDQTGTHVRLSALRGKPVVLLFYRGFW
jgi:cytochrome oxidase Cu insertion factor (SCO1/SenC/PrrC family)